MQVEESTIRVLVVDDQPAMHAIIREILRAVGITRVDTAVNGAEALDMLRDPQIKDPDLIISDIHMDGIDGLEFCNRLRRDKGLRNRNIPVVVVTGDEDDLVHGICRQLGAAEILIKPISPSELFTAIEAAIGITLVGRR